MGVSIIGQLRDRIDCLNHDPEFSRLAPHLSLTVRLRSQDDVIDIKIGDGRFGVSVPVTTPDIEIKADDHAWQQVLRVPPLPTFHSFTAWDMANSAFSITGQGLLIAQARAALERFVELITRSPIAQAASVPRDICQIRGHYSVLRAAGEEYEIFMETAGQGVPVLFLHTAGADGRQYLDQLSDVRLAGSYRLVSVDLPFHGRSLPPRNWNGEPYKLTASLYAVWCAAIVEQIIGEPAIIVGGSMGAAMALYLAAGQPELLRGAVAVEPPFKSRGRINIYQNNVAVHGGLHNGGFVRGLMSPRSPESNRRRASWIYSQSAPGIYPGDLAFYSLEFDGGIIAPKINAELTPIALLCGSYDYSASPEDGCKLASLIPGASITIMPDLGHFPMCEHPDLFRPYLLSALQHVSDQSDHVAANRHSRAI
jgi:pimeloyl-ACP methyl ester carboxylesterase